MLFKKILFAIFIIRLSLPLASLSIDEEDIPEYSEYLRRLRTTTKMARQQDQSMAFPLANFPSIQLCKEPPADGNFYGYVFCWAMLGLYVMLIFTLVIYQLRTILWLKFKFNQKNSKGNFIPFDELNNGQQSNSENIELESTNTSNIQRMLPMRSIA